MVGGLEEDGGFINGERITGRLLYLRWDGFGRSLLWSFIDQVAMRYRKTTVGN